MTHQDIIAHLCLKYPPEVIHEITTENIIAAIVRRMSEEALELSAEDLELAQDSRVLAFVALYKALGGAPLPQEQEP